MISLSLTSEAISHGNFRLPADAEVPEVLPAGGDFETILISADATAAMPQPPSPDEIPAPLETVRVPQAPVSSSLSPLSTILPDPQIGANSTAAIGIALALPASTDVPPTDRSVSTTDGDVPKDPVQNANTELDIASADPSPLQLNADLTAGPQPIMLAEWSMFMRQLALPSTPAAHATTATTYTDPTLGTQAIQSPGDAAHLAAQARGAEMPQADQVPAIPVEATSNLGLQNEALPARTITDRTNAKPPMSSPDRTPHITSEQNWGEGSLDFGPSASSDPALARPAIPLQALAAQDVSTLPPQATAIRSDIAPTLAPETSTPSDQPLSVSQTVQTPRPTAASPTLKANQTGWPNPPAAQYQAVRSDEPAPMPGRAMTETQPTSNRTMLQGTQTQFSANTDPANPAPLGFATNTASEPDQKPSSLAAAPQATVITRATPSAPAAQGINTTTVATRSNTSETSPQKPDSITTAEPHLTQPSLPAAPQAAKPAGNTAALTTPTPAPETSTPSDQPLSVSQTVQTPRPTAASPALKANQTGWPNPAAAQYQTVRSDEPAPMPGRAMTETQPTSNRTMLQGTQTQFSANTDPANPAPLGFATNTASEPDQKPSSLAAAPQATVITRATPSAPAAQGINTTTVATRSNTSETSPQKPDSITTAEPHLTQPSLPAAPQAAKPAGNTAALTTPPPAPETSTPSDQPLSVSQTVQTPRPTAASPALKANQTGWPNPAAAQYQTVRSDEPAPMPGRAMTETQPTSNRTMLQGTQTQFSANTDPANPAPLGFATNTASEPDQKPSSLAAAPQATVITRATPSAPAAQGINTTTVATRSNTSETSPQKPDSITTAEPHLTQPSLPAAPQAAKPAGNTAALTTPTPAPETSTPSDQPLSVSQTVQTPRPTAASPALKANQTGWPNPAAAQYQTVRSDEPAPMPGRAMTETQPTSNRTMLQGTQTQFSANTDPANPAPLGFATNTASEPDQKPSSLAAAPQATVITRATPSAPAAQGINTTTVATRSNTSETSPQKPDSITTAEPHLTQPSLPAAPQAAKPAGNTAALTTPTPAPETSTPSDQPLSVSQTVQTPRPTAASPALKANQTGWPNPAAAQYQTVRSDEPAPMPGRAMTETQPTSNRTMLQGTQTQFSANTDPANPAPLGFATNTASEPDQKPSSLAAAPQATVITRATPSAPAAQGINTTTVATRSNTSETSPQKPDSITTAEPHLTQPSLPAAPQAAKPAGNTAALTTPPPAPETSTPSDQPLSVSQTVQTPRPTAASPALKANQTGWPNPPAAQYQAVRSDEPAPMPGRAMTETQPTSNRTMLQGTQTQFSANTDPANPAPFAFATNTDLRSPTEAIPPSASHQSPPIRPAAPAAARALTISQQQTFQPNQNSKGAKPIGTALPVSDAATESRSIRGLLNDKTEALSVGPSHLSNEPALPNVPAHTQTARNTWAERATQGQSTSNLGTASVPTPMPNPTPAPLGEQVSGNATPVVPSNASPLTTLAGTVIPKKRVEPPSPDSHPTSRLRPRLPPDAQQRPKIIAEATTPKRISSIGPADSLDTSQVNQTHLARSNSPRPIDPSQPEPTDLSQHPTVAPPVPPGQVVPQAQLGNTSAIPPGKTTDTVHDGRRLPQRMSASLTRAALRATKDDKVELTLDPIELGKVRFDFVTTGDQMQVNLTVERGETLDLLRRHAEQLRAEFREAGFDGSSLSFSQWTPRGDDNRSNTAPIEEAERDDLVLTATEPQQNRNSTLTGGGLDLRL